MNLLDAQIVEEQENNKTIEDSKRTLELRDFIATLFYCNKKMQKVNKMYLKNKYFM